MGLAIDFVPDQEEQGLDRSADADARRGARRCATHQAAELEAWLAAVTARAPGADRRRCPTATGWPPYARGRSVRQCLRHGAQRGVGPPRLLRARPRPASTLDDGPLARVDGMSEMTYRPLGDSGLMVSAVGIGCNAFGRRVDLDGVREILDAAQDVGVTLLDTADVYGGQGASEELLGEALQGRRDEFVVATKFGMDMQGANGADHGARGSRALHPPRGRGLPAPAADRPHRPLPVPRARRRDADRGDALGADRPGPRGQGPLRRVSPTSPAGRSPTPTGPPRTGGLERFVSVQNRYSLLDRTVEAEVVPACEQFGLGMLPYFPLEYGLLTGKYRRGEAAPAGSRAAAMAVALARERRLGPDRAASRSTPSSAASRCSTSRSPGSPPSRPSARSSPARPAASRSAPTRPRCGWEPTEADLAELDEITGD